MDNSPIKTCVLQQPILLTVAAMVAIAPALTSQSNAAQSSPSSAVDTSSNSNGITDRLNYDFRIVGNDTAGILVSADAASLSGMVRSAGKVGSLVWARYNPGEASGVIITSKLIAPLQKEPLLRLVPFTPKDGLRWAQNRGTIQHYGGVNPFAPFDRGNAYFHKVGLDGFLVAVGHAMKESRAALGYIAIVHLEQEGLENAQGGDLNHEVSTQSIAKADFRWLLATPADAPGNQAFTVTIPVKNCLPSSDPIDRCQAKAGVSFLPWNESESLQTIGSTQNKGRINPYLAQAIFSAVHSYAWQGGYRFNGHAKAINDSPVSPPLLCSAHSKIPANGREFSYRECSCSRCSIPSKRPAAPRRRCRCEKRKQFRTNVLI